MKRCNYCKVNVNTDKERCPVCKNALEGEVPADYVPEFPPLQSEESDKLLKKVFNIIFVSIIGFFGISLILSLILPEYNARWSFFLGLAVVTAFVVVRISFFRNTSLPRRIFYAALYLLASVIVIDWLFFHAFHFLAEEIILEWSLIFVLPAVPSGVLITFVVLMFIDRKSMSDYYVYVFFEMLINLAPFVVYKVWGIGYSFVAYGCIILDIVIAGLLCAVNLRSIIEEVKKKLHV